MLDAYELDESTRTMVFHTGQNEDGSCVIGAAGCDWAFGTSKGGYHYSLFALVKGLSQYITPNLTDTTNFYAKAADVLIGQQGTDGSWPADLRDDASTIGATGFAILALGKVGIPVFPITAQAVPVNTTEGQSFTGQVATFTVKSTTASASGYSASINWGDGHTTTGTIAGSAGSFTVTGTHTYAEEGSYKTAVTITDVNNAVQQGDRERDCDRQGCGASCDGGASPTPADSRSAEHRQVHRRRSERGALRLHRLDQLGRRAHLERVDHRSGPNVAITASHTYSKSWDLQGRRDRQGQGRQFGDGDLDRDRSREGKAKASKWSMVPQRSRARLRHAY